jgi:hypothetical protein
MATQKTHQNCPNIVVNTLDSQRPTHFKPKHESQDVFVSAAQERRVKHLRLQKSKQAIPVGDQ